LSLSLINYEHKEAFNFQTPGDNAAVVVKKLIDYKNKKKNGYSPEKMLLNLRCFRRIHFFWPFAAQFRQQDLV